MSKAAQKKGEKMSTKEPSIFCSCSFGKDSLAMLFMLLEKETPPDEVVFYDTGMEFEAIYRTRDKIVPILQKNGIEYTELHPKNTMEFDMFEREVHERSGGTHYGYSWCGGRCRWGTRWKVNALKRHAASGIELVGIAADETKRIHQETRDNRRLPLVSWGMTEADCLRYCYDKGFYWQENGIRLYEILDRVSCWCCANKNLKELKNIYSLLPEYWQKLRILQSRTSRPFKSCGSIFDLEKRFDHDKTNH